jgi:hypothetical protein
VIFIVDLNTSGMEEFIPGGASYKAWCRHKHCKLQTNILRIVIIFGTRAYKTSATHQEVLLETGTIKEVSLEICAVKEVTAIPQLINKAESAVHPFPL